MTLDKAHELAIDRSENDTRYVVRCYGECGKGAGIEHYHVATDLGIDTYGYTDASVIATYESREQVQS